MNVFSTSKPHAMMSLAFSKARWLVSSKVRSFHKNFSSSVNWMTSGTSKVSCSHLYQYLFNVIGCSCFIKTYFSLWYFSDLHKHHMFFRPKKSLTILSFSLEFMWTCLLFWILPYYVMTRMLNNSKLISCFDMQTDKIKNKVKGLHVLVNHEPDYKQ